MLVPAIWTVPDERLRSRKTVGPRQMGDVRTIA